KTMGSGRGSWLKVGMIGAVTVVFALAYLDSRREDVRALADFSSEQAMLARAFALTVAARQANDDAPEVLFAGVPSSNVARLPTSWIVMDDSRRWTLRGPLNLEWHGDEGAT